MAKDGFDVVSDVISLINVPILTTTIDGSIWPTVIPTSENTTDISVSCLVIDNEQLQNAIVNIRIHCKSIQATIRGKIISLPNQTEFDRISNIIYALVQNAYRPTYWTDVRKMAQLYKKQDGSHGCFIQLNYHSIQENYSNI